MHFLYAVLLLVLGGVAQAGTVTIDFAELPDTGFINPGADPVLSQGFSFTSPSGSQGITSWPVGSADGLALHWCGAGFLCGSSDQMTVTPTGSHSFDLIALDLASSDRAESMLLIGAYVGGGTIQTTLEIVPSDFVTFNLGAGWTNLSSLVLDPQASASIAVGVDNIVVNVVPIPAAVWLFGSALFGLRWMRRS